MGSQQSSLANDNNKTKRSATLSAGSKSLSQGQGGRKSTSTQATTRTSTASATTLVFSGDFDPSVTFEATQAVIAEDDATEESSILDDDSEVESDDETAEQEYQQALLERRRVLEDAGNLKKLAGFYSHPEKPVQVDATATARCYFDRPNAPERLSVQDAEERADILQDLQALKQVAVDYMHPERPVVTTDATACGRNYFTRYSAPEQDDPQDAAERATILAEAAALKKLAVDYNHPEIPVTTTTTTDPCAMGRNYFSRYSALEQEDAEQAAQRARVLADAAQLKKLAVDYNHPERPVITTDPFACGRNYFSRPLAPEQETVEEAEERAQILEDAQQLKKLAIDYNHPELPVVTTDPFACGRNYFSRPSAPQMDAEEEQERARILADCAALKQKAVDYMHPELPVVTTDPFACGRNYFSRYSAPEQESLQEIEERERILAECKALKQKAVDYMHPELPVATDPTAFGRNYFTRYSAPEQEDHDIDEEHELILEELKQLKKLAVDYKHPELPVVTTDPFACARNYFTRFSAPEQEDPEVSEECVRVLADCQALKQTAVDYKHPELPAVTTDPFACARNYFTRYSAPEQMDPEEAEEQARILNDAKNLKEFALHYKHPELPVVTTDPSATGRNYFSRYSAKGHNVMVHTFPAHEHDEHHEEHHEHVEHWGMDEDVPFGDFQTVMAVPTQGKVAAGGEEEEGNLSRSPSSVMLHIGESIYD